MTNLLEIKDSILRFYARVENYANMVLKFIVGLFVFGMMKGAIGYQDKISSVPMVIILSLVCCLLPLGAMLWIGAILVLINLYALCAEAAIVGLILFAIIYFVYFRFCPKDNATAVLTIITGHMGLPYVMPNIAGLTRPVHAALTVACGDVIYFFLHGVHENAQTLTSASDAESGDKLKVLVGLILDNKELYVVLIAGVLATLVVYFVRRMRIDYAWIIANIAGTLAQIIVIIVLALIMSVQMNIILLILGSLLNIVVGFVLQFFCMNLEYSRVERVQFEDDDYYYFVQAVPKRIMAAKEKTVKQFGNTGRIPIQKDGKEARSARNTSAKNAAAKNPAAKMTSSETRVIDRKALAKELDIDEDLLNL